MVGSLSVRAGIHTDVGRRRQVNEDWCGSLEPLGDEDRQRDGWLYVVADGVGAYGTGEEASRVGGEAILAAYRACQQLEPGPRLQRAIEAGNRAVWERRREYVRQAQSRPVLSTVLAAAIVGNRAFIANVGDCRAYLVRGSSIEQLTRDHTWVDEEVRSGRLSPEQARDHPRRHVITRSLGQHETVQVDLHDRALEPGDRLVLCSDGLTQYLSDAEILQAARAAPVSMAVHALIDQANVRGGEDNITVAIIETLPAAPAPSAAQPSPGRSEPAPAPPGRRSGLVGTASDRRDHLAALGAIAQRISTSLDLNETLNAIMDSVVEVTGGERGFIMLLDETTGELVRSVGRNLEGRPTPEFSRNIVQTVFKTGRPMHVGDAMADSNLSQYHSVVAHSLRSILCTPLEVQGRRIGVVYVEHRLDAEVFSEVDLELLNAVAGQAAIALENARLYEQLKSQMAANASLRANQENVLRSINSAIVSLDAAGGVLLFNPTAEELFGVRAEYARGRRFDELLPANLQRTLRALIAAQDEVSEPDLDAIEITASLPQRGRSVLSVRAMPLADAENRRAGSVVVVNDITQQRELERARQREATEKERIKSVFGRYLAPSVIDQLMDDPRSVQLGGVRREVTVMFCDIRGFTGISERNPPEEVVAILNSYLTCATEVILGAGGTLDKFLGDGVMAFFNAPLEQADHALAAVRAAIRMQERLHGLRGVAEHRVAFGVGINSGEGVVGNIGTADLMNYTVIGDVVNVAARLQGEARAGEVLISSSVYERIADRVEVEELGAIHVKGRAQPVSIHKVVRLVE